MKKILIYLLTVLFLSNAFPVVSIEDYCDMPDKVYAKSKPKRIKIKKLKRKYTYLGEFTLTAYCSCSKCCGKWAGNHKTASGATPTAGVTVAVDPKLIEYGTRLLINEHEYIAQDCGSGIKGKRIDIFYDNHADALDFGKQKAKVYKTEKKKVKGKLKILKRK